MSLVDCINRAVRAGLMDPRRGQQARELFDENLRQAKLGLGGEEALARAREETVAEVKHAMAQMRREKLLQISRARSIAEQVKNSGAPIDRAMVAVMSQDPGVRGITSIEARHKAIRGFLQGDLNQFLERYRRDLLGRNRNKAELLDVGRELYRQQSGNKSAREIAEAWSQTAEKARRMFNAAGGDIPKRERWGLPQMHNSISVRAAGFDQWFSDIRRGIDLERMIDYRTGKPMSEDQFRLAARESFEAISTDGWSRREATGTPHGQKLSRRRMDHRFFEFKDFDAWLEYHNTYGEGDPFSVMMGHLDGMARDISALQVLGPNPTATIRWMGDVLEKDLRTEAARMRAKTDAPESRIKAAKRNLDLLWDYHSGSLNSPINGRMARGFAGTRSIVQGAQLGAAALSAITDLGFQKMAASQIGIPFSRIVRRYGSLLKPGSIEDQKIAVRIGLIADNWSRLAVAQQRYLGEVSGPELANRIVDSVLRVSGLSPWTQAGRWAFGMEFTGLLADNVGRAFKDLPKPLRDTLDNHGITSFDWEIARKSQLLEHEGAKFLRPEDIEDEAVALKILDMIHAETEFAVPSTSARGRIALIAENRPGTISGELIRSVAMYKNFAVTLMFTHLRRMMALPTAAEKGKYFAQFFLTATAMGALALQAKDISKGRDPRTMFDMSDPTAMAKFWGAAALQGGGLGIFGDFLFAQENRYGGGLAQTVAGPMVGLASDFTGYFNENSARMLAGDDPNWGGGAIDLAQRYMPGSSIWWARAGMENWIWDTLRKFGDPKYDERVRRLERRRKREYGQESWWNRGELLPNRAPNPGAVIGGQ